MLMQKWYVEDYLTHKCVKNTATDRSILWKTTMSVALMSILLNPLRKPVFTAFFGILPLHTPSRAA